MVHSMTGYGRGEIREEGFDLSVELRSVNHRFLDVSLRLPKSLAQLEGRAKEMIGQRLARGRITGAMTWGNSGVDTEEISIDREVADRYHALLCDLKKTYGLAGDVDVATMAARPDIWKVDRKEIDLEETWAFVEKGLKAALDELMAMRSREGEELAKDLSARVAVIREMGEEIEKWMPEKVQGTRDRLKERLEKLISAPEIPPERLAIEAAVMADRMDCTEECVRLRIHCDHFEQVLREGGPVGRKLNFLLQEMGRESNTIGSKASDAEVSQQVVRLKEEMEKLREQVQNIE